MSSFFFLRAVGASVHRIRALAARMPSRGQTPVIRLLARFFQEAREFAEAKAAFASAKVANKGCLAMYARLIGEAADLAYYWARMPLALRLILFLPLYSLLLRGINFAPSWAGAFLFALAAAEAKYRLRAREGNPKRPEEEEAALRCLLGPEKTTPPELLQTGVWLESAASYFPEGATLMLASSCLIFSAHTRAPRGGRILSVRLHKPHGEVAVGVAGELVGDEIAWRAEAIASAIAIGDALSVPDRRERERRFKETREFFSRALVEEIYSYS